jgi:hypothetical protein
MYDTSKGVLTAVTKCGLNQLQDRRAGAGRPREGPVVGDSRVWAGSERSHISIDTLVNSLKQTLALRQGEASRAPFNPSVWAKPGAS